MKIKSIRISNYLSFAYSRDVADATCVEFDTSGTGGSLHILVGANGSGKSNFLRILKSVLMAGISGRCFFHEEWARYLKQIPDYRNPVLGIQIRSNVYLPPNWSAGSYPQTISLTLKLNDNDFNNIETLILNRRVINEMISKYSIPGFDTNLLKPMPEADIEEVRRHDEVTFRIEGTDPMESDPSITTFNQPASQEEQFVIQYIEYFEGLQKLIAFYNTDQRKADERELPHLKNTFAWLDSSRDYQDFSAFVSINPKTVNTPDTSKSKETPEPDVFGWFKNKIAHRFIELLHERDLSRYSVKAEIRKEPLFFRINSLLNQYLGIDMIVEKPAINSLDIEIKLANARTRKRVHLNTLSSGEKSIFLFIFSLFAYDLRNGVIIIDEPELHLHPQTQQVLIRLIKQVQEEFDMQFILATHSPILINRDTIRDVYRFNLNENHKTRVVKPVIDEDEKVLVKILDYTNSSKIFFVNRIVLVEGETDEYFCRFYLDWLAKNTELRERIVGTKAVSLEFLNINGKTAFTKWKKFLEKFGLSVCFIGDWDNISRLCGIDIEALKAHHRQAEALAGRTITEKDYPALINYIEREEPTTHNEIQNLIESNYADGVFILKHGEIENYLGINERGMAGIIRFCNKNFEAWLEDHNYAKFKAELDLIFERITR